MNSVVGRSAAIVRRHPIATAIAAGLALLGVSAAFGQDQSAIGSMLRVLALSPASDNAGKGPGAPGSRPAIAPVVTVSRPVARDIVEWDEYTGRFEAVEFVEVRARVAGYLDTIHFKDGQLIAKGNLLYTIDPRPFQRAVEQAGAEVAQAQTKIDNSNLDVVRGQPLLERKVLSQKTFDDRSNLKREAEAALKVAVAKLRTAELDLAFTKVTAPISGRMSRTLVTAGNYVTAGGTASPTLLTTIISENPIYLYFDVNESNAIKYRRLLMSEQTGGIGERKASVEIALPDETGFPHTGLIDFTEQRLDVATGTQRARAVVDNTSGLFSAGMFARLRVAGSPAATALLLPDEAIGSDQVNKFVLVVGDDGIVQRKVVRLGGQVAGLRVVRSGLSAGDWIVVNGIQRARPGQKVDARREQMKSSAAAGAATTSSIAR